jgi:hypothetical protein
MEVRPSRHLLRGKKSNHESKVASPCESTNYARLAGITGLGFTFVGQNHSVPPPISHLQMRGFGRADSISASLSTAATADWCAGPKTSPAHVSGKTFDPTPKANPSLSPDVASLYTIGILPSSASAIIASRICRALLMAQQSFWALARFCPRPAALQALAGAGCENKKPRSELVTSQTRSGATCLAAVFRIVRVWLVTFILAPGIS